MCAHFEGVVDPTRLREHFRAVVPAGAPGRHALSPMADRWSGHAGLFIRTPAEADSGDEAVPEREAVPGIFDLVPNWAHDLKLARNPYPADRLVASAAPSTSTRSEKPKAKPEPRQRPVDDAQGSLL